MSIPPNCALVPLQHSTVPPHITTSVTQCYIYIQYTQRSAFMQEEVLKFHKQNRAQGLHKVKLKDSPQLLYYIWRKETDN